VPRILSISLTLLLWLGPIASLLPGVDESQLPFCCRRHGAHHCAMDTPAQTPGLAFKAPSRCPQFPAALAASTAPASGLASSIAGPFSLLVGKFSPGVTRDDARAGQARNCADRGPPTAAIA
jgi:hypothetical protein